ncbi:MAG: DegT/DnrJ/EryC1/StrS family aminotransferase [Anaerolineales bacterium]|nr:DegT/DnrJ/EryC1/StrS family aminotransferase [Anaerolineales bacterium]
MNVPMSSPDLTDAERAAVNAVMHTNRLSMGPEEKQFEKAVADYIGVKHAVAVSSGTTGLHLLVRAAGIHEGDFVITSPFSFVSSTNVILFERAVPVFVDVDPDSCNLNPEQVAQAAANLAAGGKAAERWLPRKGAESAERLKAILAVDIFGQMADYDRIIPVAQQYGLDLLEDSCEAFGATYKGRPAGLEGDAGIFAFYPNKQITTGEGAMIVTNRDDWAAVFRSLRNQGRAPGDAWLDHTYLGYNYRINELASAIGRVQMTRLDEMLEKRAQVAAWYGKRLKEFPAVETLQVVETTTRMSWFVYIVRFDPAFDRDEVIRRLADFSVPCRPYFSPIHLQTYMREMFGYREGDFPVTEDLGRRSAALPFSSVMTREQVDYVCDSLSTVLSGME